MNISSRRQWVWPILFLTIACIVDGMFWYRIASLHVSAPAPRIVIFNVGEGDAALAILPGDVKILIDAGPDAKILTALEDALGPDDRVIDVAIISNPAPASIGGFAALLDHYQFGAFAYGGRKDGAANDLSLPALLAAIAARHIPLLTVGAGDRILARGLNGKGEADVLSPDPAFAESADPDEAALVVKAQFDGVGVVLLPTAAAARRAATEYSASFRADAFVLAEAAFKGVQIGTLLPSGGNLRAIVVQAGAREAAGKSFSAMLKSAASSTPASLFVTGRDGTVELSSHDGALRAEKGS
jgi:hypothetical protein